jgi:hypothetical protein
VSWFLLSFKPQKRCFFAIVCAGRLAGFKLQDFSQPPAMPIRTAEPGSKEVLGAVPGNRNTRGATPQAEDIHVGILYALACREIVMTKRRARARHFVGSHRGAHTAAAHENASLNFSRRNGTG